MGISTSLMYACTCLHLWSRFDYEMEEHHPSAQRGSTLGYLIQRAREPGFGFVYVGKDLHSSSGRRECECSDIADGLGNPFVSFFHVFPPSVVLNNPDPGPHFVIGS